MKPIFIIEHLEPKLWRWCEIEYKNISKITKKRVWFTNLKSKKLKPYGKVISKSIKHIPLQDACVLDPEAPQTLTPKEAKKFKYFIFGGILGDYPPKKRTKKELTKFISNAEVRNIGKKQLSTDNAVLVVNEIVHGKKLQDIRMQNKAEIKINKIESIILPYSYPIIDGKPQMSKELLTYLRKKRTF